MLETLWLCFAWLPLPLNVLAFGLFCLLFLAVGVKILRIIAEFIPFL